MFNDGCVPPEENCTNDFGGYASFDWFKDASGHLIYIDRVSGKIFRSKTLKHNIPNVSIESEIKKYFSSLFPIKPWRVRVWETSYNKLYFVPSYVRLHDLEHGTNIVFVWRDNLIISPSISEYTCESCIGIRLLSAERNHDVMRAEILARESERLSGVSEILNFDIGFMGSEFQKIIQNIKDINNPLSYFRWSKNTGIVHKPFFPLPGDHKEHKKMLTKYMEIKN